MQHCGADGPKEGLALGRSAQEKLASVFETARRQADFGNGRYVRNVLEKAKMAQATRLLTQDYESLTQEDLTTCVPRILKCLRFQRRSSRRLASRCKSPSHTVARFCPTPSCIIRYTVIEYGKRGSGPILVKQPKKLLILNILDILRKYSDEEHRLSQKGITEILKTEYDMTADRKAIRRNILNLMDCGYNIEYSESIRMVPNPKTGVPEESYLWSDFYLERDFTDGELRLLIDGLLFSKHIPYSQCKELVDKLEGLSNVYFRSRVKYIARLPEDKTDNKQLFLTIELLDEAISGAEGQLQVPGVWHGQASA